jgi:hypothetical protein
LVNIPQTEQRHLGFWLTGSAEMISYGEIFKPHNEIQTYDDVFSQLHKMQRATLPNGHIEAWNDPGLGRFSGSLIPYIQVQKQ